jgi:hypothetical protein
MASGIRRRAEVFTVVLAAIDDNAGGSWPPERIAQE